VIGSGFRVTHDAKPQREELPHQGQNPGREEPGGDATTRGVVMAAKTITEAMQQAMASGLPPTQGRTNRSSQSRQLAVISCCRSRCG
jgi:hypothetical protein